MAVIVLVDIPGGTQEQYDAVQADLTAQGLLGPEGRLWHAAGPGPDGWHVTDLWESEEAFGRFGESLMPLLQKHGLHSNPPAILPLYNALASGADYGRWGHAVIKNT